MQKHVTICPMLIKLSMFPGGRRVVFSRTVKNMFFMVKKLLSVMQGLPMMGDTGTGG